MIDQEQSISYHTIRLGDMTREGDARAEISELDGEGTEQRRTVHVPAGLPGERVTIAVEAPARPSGETQPSLEAASAACVDYRDS